MIRVNAPLKREYIIELLNHHTIEGITFSFERQDGMRLYFNHDGEAERAAVVAKKTIKSSEFGVALYFNTEVV